MRPITDCLPPVRRRSLRKARILVCRHFQLLDLFPFLLSSSKPAMPFPPSPPLSLSLTISIPCFIPSSRLFFIIFLCSRPAKQIKLKKKKKTRQTSAKHRYALQNSKISVLLSQSLRVPAQDIKPQLPHPRGGERWV